MDLRDICTMAMVNAVGEQIVEQATDTDTNAPRMRFHTTTGDIPGTYVAELTIPASNITTDLWQDTDSDNTTGATGTFTTIASNTADSDGTVAYFSIVQHPTNSTVVLTGEVGESGSDINFNTVEWDTGDNISITSLSFTMPK